MEASQLHQQSAYQLSLNRRSNVLISAIARREQASGEVRVWNVQMTCALPLATDQTGAARTLLLLSLIFL